MELAMETRTSNKDIRILNRGLVLECIARGNGISRVDLARQTSLTKTSITNVAGELLAQGILCEASPESKRVHTGRKPVLLKISKDAPVICSILIKRHRLQVVIGNLQGIVLDSLAYEYEGLIDPEQMFEKLSSAFLILSRRCSSRIAGVGISCVGPIDTVTGAILNPPNFFDRACSYPIVNRMRKLANVPVYFPHDTSASVLAEKLYGTQICEKNFVFLSTFQGLGAGLVLDGKVYSGCIGQEGEIGHMSIREDGPLCTCGNRGCLEQYASVEAMRHKLEACRTIFPDHPFMQKASVSFADFIAYADQNDPLGLIIVDEYCRHVSTALINLVNLLDINLIVIEYDTYSNGNTLETLLEKYINRGILSSKYRHIRVRQSEFGKDISAKGAIAAASIQIFQGNMIL